MKTLKIAPPVSGKAARKKMKRSTMRPKRATAKRADAETLRLRSSRKFAEIIEKSYVSLKKEGGLSIEKVRRRLGLREKA